jgi:hypothetical protein
MSRLESLAGSLNPDQPWRSLMADAYTTFWTHERCDTLRRLGWSGRSLEVLFGGPHISEPSFRRACVRPGDDIYPIAVRNGILSVLGRVRVQVS